MSNPTYAAFGSDPQTYGLLRKNVLERWATITRELASRWDTVESDRLLAERLSGCLDKLSASLCQVNRLKNHHDGFLAMASNRPANASYVAFRGADACADFEGLLLQGRACLDRLTWLIAGEFRQRCSSFRQLGNILKDFPNNALASSLLAVVSSVQQCADSIYAQIDAPDSLRDMVGHRRALTERMRTCFGIWWLDAENALMCDCEIQMSNSAPTIAIFEASAQSAEYLPFAVIESASLLLGFEPLGAQQYFSAWKPLTVPLSRYLLNEPDGAELGEESIRFAQRMTPSGFVVESKNADPRIRERFISLRDWKHKNASNV